MYGRIGDILQNYGRRGQTDGVNKWASWVRRERVWLPERNTNPNTVLENLKKPQILQAVNPGADFRRRRLLRRVRSVFSFHQVINGLAFRGRPI